MRDLGEPLPDETGKAFYRYNDRGEVFHRRLLPWWGRGVEQMVGSKEKQRADPCLSPRPLR